VPASVRSKPEPSSRCTRSASGPRPGRGGLGDSESLQRSQPALLRWTTRCSPSVSTSMNLPRRTTSVISSPPSAVGSGSYVLSTLTAATSTRATTRPTIVSRRNEVSASTSGNSGTSPSWHVPRGRGTTTAADHGIRCRRHWLNCSVVRPPPQDCRVNPTQHVLVRDYGGTLEPRAKGAQLAEATGRVRIPWVRVAALVVFGGAWVSFLWMQTPAYGALGAL